MFAQPALRPALVPVSLRTCPPSSHLIDAVIRFADQRRRTGAQRSELSVSHARMCQPDVIEALGADWRRITSLRIVWDDSEGQMVRILDDSQIASTASDWWEDYYERFESEDSLALAA